MEAESAASRPIPLGGDFGAYWRIGGARVAKLGARGGFVHPLSGSPFADALRTALALTRLRDFSGRALHDLFQEEAQALWSARDWQRGLARRAVADAEPLRGLFGLEAGLLARLVSGRAGLFERRRIASATGG